jgi:hypothetical protein
MGWLGKGEKKGNETQDQWVFIVNSSLFVVIGWPIEEGIGTVILDQRVKGDMREGE